MTLHARLIAGTSPTARPIQIDFPGFEIDAADIVVDIGCGVGDVCVYAGHRGAEVVGIDIEDVLVDRARESMRDVPARSFRGLVSDCDPIPLPDATADVVVCNADLPGVYASLLPGIPPPRVVRRGTYAPSAVVWHAGVRGPLPERAAHHNIHFGRSWDASFRALLDHGRRMDDPSLLVSIPSIDEWAPGSSTAR